MVENYLSAGLEVPFQEIRVLLRKYRGHQNVDGVADYLSLAVAEHLGEALARLEDLPDGFLVPAQVNDGRVVAEEDLMRLASIVHVLFAKIRVEGSLNILVSVGMMVPDVFEIFTIDIEGVRVVRINLAEHVPELVDFLGGFIGSLPQIIKDVEVRYYSRQVGPELDLYVAHLLNRPLHLSEESLELNHIRKLRIDILVL